MPEKREKVVVAMSGGVDSSVAACLLIEQGYDVVGLFMRVGAADPPADDTSFRAATVRERDGEQEEIPLSNPPEADGSGSDASSRTDQPTTSETSRRLKPAARVHQGCCSASDAADARFVAGMLNVPFYALNFQADFDKIIDYFADEYVNGRTPNPCVVCNDKLKFGKVVDYADAIGAKYIATGHYARIGERHGQRVLMRGRDEKKDQSYVLFGLEREILDRVLFPVGELTKDEVRAMAERFNLPNRNKPDSVDICFVPDRDYARVVKERRPEAFVAGDVLDGDGATIGRHQGVANYTVGQRRGLGIAAGKPIYVTQLNVADNTVTMGPDEDLLQPALIAGRANFLIDPPDGPFRADVKIRYLHKAAPATVEVLRGEANSCAPRAAGFSLRERSERDDVTQANVTLGGMPHACVGMSSDAPTDDTSFQTAISSYRDATVRERDGKQIEKPLPYGHGSERSSRGLENGPGSDMPTWIRVVFDEPQRAITPGQAVVFYDGDVVLGGAWIERADSVACSTNYSTKEALI